MPDRQSTHFDGLPMQRIKHRLVSAQALQDLKKVVTVGAGHMGWVSAVPKDALWFSQDRRDHV